MCERRCIITNEPITPENNSRAHVIPSALGGRLKPLNILSKNGNSQLGDKIDLPLIQAFQALMTLLNGSRDRGQNQPVLMTDEGGRTYIIKFGEPLKLGTINYEEKLVDGGTAIHIDARNLKELRTLLGRVKAKYSEFDIDEAMKHAIEGHNWPDGMLHGQLQIGPRVVFPALFVSASIFAAHQGHPPHPELRDYVSHFDPDQPQMPPHTFYFIPPQQWISAPGEMTHIIALLASAERREMLVYFELFNVVSVAVLLPYSGPKDAGATYAVDVLTGTELRATVHEDVIRAVPWQATHKLGDSELYRLTQERMGRLIGLSQARARETAIDALTSNAFGLDKNQPLTLTDHVGGIGKLVDFTLLEWKRPLVTLEHMEEDLRGFDRMIVDFEKMILPPNRQAYRDLIAPHRHRLEIVVEQKRQLTVT